MLEPKEIDIDGKKYIIHKFPAWQGVLLVSRIPQAMAMDFENSPAREAVWAEIMSYVSVPIAKGMPLALTTQELVNNHVKSWKQMHELFKAVMEYNDGFLVDGKL